MGLNSGFKGLIFYPIKWLLSETGQFNKKSRTSVLRPQISFVMSVSERNAETKQLHPTRLTQGSIIHHYFREGGQATFPALCSSLHFTYSRLGSYQALAVAGQGFEVGLQRQPFLNHTRIMNGGVTLQENGLFHRDRAFVQRAPLRSAKCVHTEDRPGDLL